MTPERIARVWLWLSWMHEKEGDDLHYRWPPEQDDQVLEEEAYDRAQACAQRAEQVRRGATRELWADAMDSFDNPDFTPGEEHAE